MKFVCAYCRESYDTMEMAAKCEERCRAKIAEGAALLTLVYIPERYEWLVEVDENSNSSWRIPGKIGECMESRTMGGLGLKWTVRCRKSREAIREAKLKLLKYADEHFIAPMHKALRVAIEKRMEIREDEE